MEGLVLTHWDFNLQEMGELNILWGQKPGQATTLRWLRLPCPLEMPQATSHPRLLQCPPCLTSPRSEGLEALTLCSCCSRSPRWQSTASLVSRTAGSSFSRGCSAMGFSVPRRRHSHQLGEKLAGWEGHRMPCHSWYSPQRKSFNCYCFGKLSHCQVIRAHTLRTGTQYSLVPPGPGQALQHGFTAIHSFGNSELKVSSTCRKTGESVNCRPAG